MTPRCAELEAYADGELDPARVPAFENHLLTCAECQRGFADLMQLATLAQEAALRVPALPRRSRQFRRPQVMTLALAASLLVAAVTGAALWRLQGPVDSELWLADAPERLLEARVSLALADRYRPYSVPRAVVGQVPPPSLTELGVLERKGDRRGIAVAYLVRRQVEQAAPYLDTTGAAPEADVDRAAAALLRNEHVAALGLADRALRADPGNAQALWNRALALRDLGLPYRAAEDFELVAVLGEPGWSGEARRLARALRDHTDGRRAAWDALGRGCRRLILEGDPLPPEQVRQIRGWSRACFYDAVRAAPSRERVLSLMPMATLLDELYGNAAATAFARRAAGRDFSRRAALARTYAALATSSLPAAEIGPFIEKLRASGEDDILLGALLFAPDLPLHLGEYRQLATATGDPWFQLLAEEKQGYAEVRQGRPAQAVERLVRVLERCNDTSRQGYRCGWLERTLASAYAGWHQPVPARKHALRALGRATEGGEWFLEQHLLMDLGQVARLEGDLPLMRAYLEEALIRSNAACVDGERIHTNLAQAYQLHLEFGEARRHLDEAARCPGPATLARANAVADISRVLPGRDDERVIRESLDALRASGTVAPGTLALARHVEGRFHIERDRARGQSLLREAIEAADGQPASDVVAQKARAYSYTSLILDAGKHGERERARELFGEELAAAPPSGCFLGATVDDERTFFLWRGEGGELAGRYDASRRAPLESVAGLVPADVVSALRGCDAVEVIARPPLAGQADLLPADMAWSYRVSRGPARPAGVSEVRRLIVAGAVPPASLGLAPLSMPEPGEAGPAVTVLRGEQATPGQVLEAMRRATEIQIHAHGLVDQERSDASFIALSPDLAGEFALTAAELKRTRLERRPVVLLAACHAARTARRLHESFGLPAAFIDAGARMVLASTHEIPDARAAAFFESVLERIRAGQTPAIALRDARVQWKDSRRERWVEQVLLFE